MSVADYREASLSLNGVPAPMTLTSLSYGRTDAPREAAPLKPFTASGTLELTGDDARRVFACVGDLLGRRGASLATLARRVEYGGRKGRSAWRRLRAEGYVGTLRINDEAPVPCPPVTFSWDEVSL